MEEMRDAYHEALDASETRLWSGEADLEPWIRFFLEALSRHRERVEAKVDDIEAGFYVKEDGIGNPVDITMCLAKGARIQGATLLEGVGKEIATEALTLAMHKLPIATRIVHRDEENLV